jgi:hypothetical protein
MLTIKDPEQNEEGHANVIASEKLTLTVNSIISQRGAAQNGRS